MAEKSPHTASSYRTSGVTACELSLVFLATMAGAYLRLRGLDQVSLTHFDEGVYVLWGQGLDYPGKEYFAPPMFPLLLRTASWIFAPPDVTAIGVNSLFGTLVVPLVWWVARRWYGQAAGVCCAAMAACSDYHVAFSRMALTDVTFTFWFVLTLWFVSEMFLRCGSKGESPPPGKTALNTTAISFPRGWGWAVAAGPAAGAALNTKYNGCLVLLLPLAAVGCAVLLRKLRSQWRPAAALWLCTAISLIGLVLYLPWALHVSREIGYASLLEHHRGYATGLASWPDNLVTMLLSHRYLSGWIGRLAPSLGVLAALLVSGRGLRGCFSAAGHKLSLLGCALALGLLVGDAAGWVLGLAAVPLLVPRFGVVAVLHGTWLVGLAGLTPLYHPYARLMMPLVAAGWVSAGALVVSLLGGLEGTRLRETRGIAWAFGCVSLLLAAVALEWKLPVPPQAHPSDRTLREACGRLARRLPLDQRVDAFVRPPVLFYLGGRLSMLDSLPAAAPGAGERYLLIDTPMLRDNPAAAKWRDNARDQLTELARENYSPPGTVLLDDFGRRCFSPEFMQSPQAIYSIVLYRIIYIPSIFR